MDLTLSEATLVRVLQLYLDAYVLRPGSGVKVAGVQKDHMKSEGFRVRLANHADGESTEEKDVAAILESLRDFQSRPVATPPIIDPEAMRAFRDSVLHRPPSAPRPPGPAKAKTADAAEAPNMLDRLSSTGPIGGPLVEPASASPMPPKEA